ncbi:hypothetical protein O3M35_000655 [Rhynocoris fuscipes]|uniref:Selenoprotein S n=1 Tax=Rhynocoris fuscipes TaxID=488301 RepID=A0AAW1DQB4_9HEMI
MSNFDFDDDSGESAAFLVKGTDLLVNYGWYIVGLGIFYLVFRDKINALLDSWYTKRAEREYAAKYHKNPDLGRARLEAMEAARQRMQEELNRKAAEAEIRKKELEEKKRLEKLQRLSGDTGGNRLGGAASSKYNPLMNDSGGRYKPPKRSCCKKGGGCG